MELIKMINSRSLKCLLVVAIISLVSACKIAVIVVEGGAVESDFGWGPTCTEGTVCIHEVNSTGSSRYFAAVPKPGWRFVEWKSGDDFLCPASVSSECEAVNPAGNAVGAAIVASSKTFYLMPIFAPLTEIGATVTMDGKAWAPMNSFGDLSWDEINDVCPVASGGHCLAGGKLMEYDMTGWTWASVDDVNALINSHLSSPAIGPGPDELPTITIGIQLRQARFPATAAEQSCSGCTVLTWKGWTSTPSGIAGQSHLAEVFFSGSFLGFGGHSTTLLTDDNSAGHSVWFYRTP